MLWFRSLCISDGICVFIPGPQASEGYLLQARSVEKRWRRDMQSERDLRLRLQENMETMANQIHGLENDAKRSVGGGGRGHRSASQGSREVFLSPSAATDTGRGVF